MFKSLAFSFLIFLVLFSCDKPAVSIRKEEPVINKTRFLKNLSVSGRVWRFEKLVIEYKDSTRKVDFKNPDQTIIPWSVLDGPIHNNSLTFRVGLNRNTLEEIISSGPYGDQAYPDNRGMWATLMGITNDGTWQWDDDRNTVAIGPAGSIKSIISAASNNRFTPETGYIDNQLPPEFESLSEALQGSKPERIRIHMVEGNPRLGKIDYWLYLRGAWIREVIPGGRQSLYKVTY